MDSFDIVRGIRYWRIGKCFGRYSSFTTNKAAIFWQHKTVSIQSNKASLDERVSFEEPEVNFRFSQPEVQQFSHELEKTPI